MNKKTKKILMKGSIALVILGIVAIFVFAKGADNENYKAPVGKESIMTGAEGFLYYNDDDNKLWRRDIGDDKAYMINESLPVLAAYKDEVLVSSGESVSVIKYDGTTTDKHYNAVTSNAELTAEHIYYKNSENGYVMRIDRSTGTDEEFVRIAVDKFAVYSNKLIFTTPDRKMIYVYDMETKMPMGYFGDKDIVDFDVDENCLVYADAANDYKVSRMNLSTLAEEEIKGVQTKTMEYRNGRLFYIENHKKDAKSYKLKVKEIDVH